MESFVQLRQGRTPSRVHADLDGLKDDELGRSGFVGRQAQLYRQHDPTAFRVEGALRPFDAPTSQLHTSDKDEPRGTPTLLLSNDDCRISVSRRSTEMPFHTRNIDADEVYFVHRGGGTFETEFGPLSYRPGDYVYLPKATTYRHRPDGGDSHLLLVESYEELRVPLQTPLGRHWPFDSTFVQVPEPQVAPETGQEEWEVRLAHSGQHTSLFYPHDPCDVEGWRGDNFPFAMNIADYNVMTSDSVHLPPSVHLFLQSSALQLVHFLPRPAEGVPGTERIPWYHRNVDFDEVAFYHDGSVFGVDMPPALLSHAPQGIHHGPPERARARARRLHDEYQRVEWTVINIDTRRRLTPSDALIAAATDQTDQGAQ